jgi:hypothetical protein
MSQKNAIGFYVMDSAVAPVFVSATVENAAPTKIVLTYDQTLDGASVPATSDFTVTDHTISSVAIVGATVELTLSTAGIYFDIIYTTYTKGANPIQGSVGGMDAVNLASTLITNNILKTGNEVFQYLASDLTTITKDVSQFVSRWNDKLGSGRDLIQATGTNQPLWVTPGSVLLDGLDNFMKTAAIASLDQPEFIIMVFRQVTWTNNDTVFDGATANKGKVVQSATTPGLVGYAGAASAQNNNLAVNTWGIMRCLFNGVSSKLQINVTAATTFNCGTAHMGGFTLGARGDNTLFGNIEVKEIIGLDVAPTSDYETSLYNVVKRRNGL